MPDDIAVHVDMYSTVVVHFVWSCECKVPVPSIHT